MTSTIIIASKNTTIDNIKKDIFDILNYFDTDNVNITKHWKKNDAVFNIIAYIDVDNDGIKEGLRLENFIKENNWKIINSIEVD